MGFLFVLLENERTSLNAIGHFNFEVWLMCALVISSFSLCIFFLLLLFEVKSPSIAWVKFICFEVERYCLSKATWQYTMSANCELISVTWYSDENLNLFYNYPILMVRVFWRIWIFCLFLLSLPLELQQSNARLNVNIGVLRFLWMFCRILKLKHLWWWHIEAY